MWIDDVARLRRNKLLFNSNRVLVALLRFIESSSIAVEVCQVVQRRCPSMLVSEVVRLGVAQLIRKMQALLIGSLRFGQLADVVVRDSQPLPHTRESCEVIGIVRLFPRK